MHLEYVPVGKDGVKMLNHAGVTAINSMQVVAPHFEADRKEINEKRTLNLCVPQVFHIGEQVVAIRSLARLESHKSSQMLVVVLESLLSHSFARARCCQ